MLSQVFVSVLLIAGCLLLYEAIIHTAAAKPRHPQGSESMMLNKPRLIWINDWLSQPLTAVMAVGAVTLYLIVARGWAW